LLWILGFFVFGFGCFLLFFNIIPPVVGVLLFKFRMLNCASFCFGMSDCGSIPH
jgi:hypothetical protein